jgi:DNA-binding transcriptional MerR regulator
MIQHQKVSMHKRQFRIGDLAKELNLKKFIIRFWEKEFNIKSDRSSGGQRFYTQEDLSLFLTIKDLLYSQGFTISGAKKQLQMQNSQAPAPVKNEVAAAVQEAESELIEALADANNLVDDADLKEALPVQLDAHDQVTEGAFVDQQMSEPEVESAPFSAQPAEVDREDYEKHSPAAQEFFSKLNTLKAQIQKLDELLG